jgi:hypothetical protein
MGWAPNFWMKVLADLNGMKFEFGPCPDALLLSPPAGKLAYTVSFG